MKNLSLKELISKITGQTEFRYLLWTNPGNTWGAAKVTISDLSDYDEVLILAAGFQNSNYVYSRCPVGKDGLIQCFTTSPDNTQGTWTFMNTASRHYTTASDGVTFENGQMTYAGGIYQNWDSRAVPLKIWGIKYVGGVVRRLFYMLSSRRVVMA